MNYDIVTHSSQADWHAARLTGLGASEMATVLGLNPYRSALQLYAEKVGAIEPEDLSDREAVQMGILLEPFVIDRYRERSGRWAERDGHLLRSREHAWATCTLDGKTIEGEPEPEKAWPLEVKTTGAFRAEDWVDGPPDVYMVQIQHQMMVVGTEKATIACLIGGQKLVWCDVPRDEQMIRKIIFHGQIFWERVQQKSPPPADGPGARDALRNLYPVDDGNTVELPRALLDVIDELDEVKAAEKEAGAKRAALEARIQEAMGNASRGIILGGATVTWKQQVRKAAMMPESRFRVLRISRPKVA